MTEELGLRERKRRERRSCIEDAALDLFDANGFDQTTIGDIAAAADIAPRTFFYYFPTKEDVVLADYAGRLDRIIGELSNRPSNEGPWPALQASFAAVAADYEIEREGLTRRFSIMANNASVSARSLELQAGWEDGVAGVLSQRMETGSEDLAARLLASAALACMRSSLRHWVAHGQHQRLPDLVLGCFDRLAAGLGDAA